MKWLVFSNTRLIGPARAVNSVRFGPARGVNSVRFGPARGDNSVRFGPARGVNSPRYYNNNKIKLLWQKNVIHFLPDMR